MYKADRILDSIRNFAGAKTAVPAQSAKGQETASRISRIHAALDGIERKAGGKSRIAKLEAELAAVKKEISAWKNERASNKKHIGMLERDVSAVKKGLLAGQKGLAENKKYLGLLSAKIRAIKNAKRNIMAGKPGKMRKQAN